MIPHSGPTDWSQTALEVVQIVCSEISTHVCMYVRTFVSVREMHSVVRKVEGGGNVNNEAYNGSDCIYMHTSLLNVSLLFKPTLTRVSSAFSWCSITCRLSGVTFTSTCSA